MSLKEEIAALFENKYESGKIDFQLATIAVAGLVLGIALWTSL